MEIKKNTKTSFDAYQLCYFFKNEKSRQKRKKSRPLKNKIRTHFVYPKIIALHILPYFF